MKKTWWIMAGIAFVTGSLVAASELPADWCQVVEPEGAVTAGSESTLAEVPLQCDGTCVVDVAFSYFPAAVDGWAYSGIEPRIRRAKDVSELRQYVHSKLALVSGMYQSSGVDVEFRLLSLVPARPDLRLGRGSRPRGADLWYAIDPAGQGTDGRYVGGIARVPGRSSNGHPVWPDGLDGIVRWEEPRFVETNSGTVSIDYSTTGDEKVLAHEFGHSLGLAHGPTHSNPGTSPWPGGHGFVGRHVSRFATDAGMVVREASYGTIMAYGYMGFSENGKILYGRPVGDDVANAVQVLRQNVPHAAARASRSPIDTPDYGCIAGRCIDAAGRFQTEVRFQDPSLDHLSTARLSTAPVGDSAGLFFFFDSGNPEMLLKVLNGCGINGHWWVFGSAATDLLYEVTIRDLAADGRKITYRHVGKSVIAGSNGFTGMGVINDSRAFTCQ